MALLSAAAAPVSFLHSISSYGLRTPFPCEARPRAPLRRGDLAIRMGGGPRTFPGGVSKWQWKRMQARKAKQLLKARLARERQLYEMRKRAELRDAVAHLELPWDPDSSASASAVAAAPNLLSVAADDQLKALADRFYRPGGVDLWNDRDGPKVFATPGTGRASARFFPKDAIHSVQPYALLGGGAEITPAARGSAADPTDRSDRAQGARQNAAKKETHGVGGDHKPAVEYIERDGVWEPVNKLDGGAYNNSSHRRSSDDNVTSDLEDMDDVNSQPKQRAMVRRDRKKGSMASWEAANTTMAVGSNDFSDWHGNGVFSDQESTREDHLGQRWKERNSESRWKRPAGRRQALSTDGRSAIGRHRVIGSNSFSDSEVTSNGCEPKWRGRSREGTMDGAGRWKHSNGGSGNVARKGFMDDKFDSASGRARDGSRLEPEWNTWSSRLKRGENGRGKPELKYAAHTIKGERPGRFMKSSNGDGRRDRFVSHFASDLEEPKWKPRRKEGAWTSNGNGRREYSDDMSGRFRRGGNRAVRLPDANTTNDNKENGSNDGIGRHRMNRNGGRRHRGDGYSLRPTSELHSSGRERE